MADAPSAPKYRAFIAYSRRNTRAAERLFARLEQFRIGKDLTGRQTALGTVPAALRPIFLDRFEFDAGTSLSAQTAEALDNSAALIVLASPDAAQSWNVNEEVRVFRHRHPDRRIIPAIVAATPDAGTDVLFPPALRFALDADGAVTRDPDEVPLGADERSSGDGRDRAFAKIVAGLTGLHMDDVYQRDRRRRRRLAVLQAVVTAVVLLLAGAGGFFSWRAHQQAGTIAANQQTLGEIEALVRQYQPVGSAQAAVPGGQQNLVAAFKSIAEGAATDPRYAQALALLKQGKPAEAEPLLRAVAEDMEKRRQRDASQEAEAYRNLGAIAGLADPTHARAYYAHAVALDPDNAEGLYWSGWLELAAGNLDAAERDYRHLLELRQVTPEEAFWARSGLGDIAVARGALSAALVDYRTAEAGITEQAKADPTNAGWQRDLSVSDEKVGDVLVAQGKLDEALQSYRAGLAVIERLAKADPNNAGWQRDLSISLGRVADMLLKQGYRDEARPLAARALAQVRAAIARMPGDPRISRDLPYYEGLLRRAGGTP